MREIYTVMIMRFTIKNLFSFKDETEFNLFPNRTTNLSHHKISLNGINVLRLSAIYGANGSGKSNLVKAIMLLDKMIFQGKIPDEMEDLKFKLSRESQKEPVSIGIEFYCHPHIYYYSISFDDKQVLYEYFAESKTDTDILIFERKLEQGIHSIQFFPEYYKDAKNKLFAEVLAEKLISGNEVLLTFLAGKYATEFIDIKNAVEWFRESLIIITPNAKPGAIANILDNQGEFKIFANELFSSLNTGVSKIEVVKESLDDMTDNSLSGLNKELVNFIIDKLKDETEGVMPIPSRSGEELTVVKENGKVYIKKLITKHRTIDGEEIPFNVSLESDGTKRLIDYIPALQNIIHKEKVYIIDEIERSIHPLTIKEIVKKISHDTKAKGQLIFSTHESNLLDQDILRTDEIWFAQKDVDGSSKLYSLSDFKVHSTINIENGYLNGRYGGIPFLSNLRDLNWHKDEVFE